MLKTLGDYITSLLDFEPKKVIIGRQNYIKLDTTDDHIIVDYLSSNNIGSTSTYDGVGEVMNLTNITRYRVTIASIGDNANEIINRLSVMLKSQKSLELQRELGIDVGASLGVKNLKELSGSIYTNFYEIEVNVIVSNVADVETLRIDEAEFKIQNENGVIIDGLI